MKVYSIPVTYNSSIDDDDDDDDDGIQAGPSHAQTRTSFPPYTSPLALNTVDQVTFQTSHGQQLDLITAPIGTVDLSKYTLDNYMRIVSEHVQPMVSERSVKLA